MSSNDHDTRRMAGVMLTLMWLLILGGGTLLASRWLEQRNAVQVLHGAEGSEMIIPADAYGHYQIDGLINGHKVRMLVDTGATGVAIPAHLAGRLGLRPGSAARVSTANGVVRVRRTQVHTLQLGPFMLADVPAHLNPGMQEETILLGMSVLGHFRLSQHQGELTIAE